MEYKPTQKDRFNYGDNASVRGSYSGYIAKDYIIRFENARIKSTDQDVVEFKAFITAFNENYNSNFTANETFGRTDPIYQYNSV